MRSAFSRVYFTRAESGRSQHFAQERKRIGQTFRERRHGERRGIPVRLRIDRRAQSLEALRELGTVARLRALEHQLGHELRGAFRAARIAHPARVDEHDDGHDRQLRHLRDDELESVFQSVGARIAESGTRAAAPASGARHAPVSSALIPPPRRRRSPPTRPAMHHEARRAGSRDCSLPDERARKR